MPCYHPLTAWRGPVNAQGRHPLVFKKPVDAGLLFEERPPCGQCIGCRLERSRQWGLRCVGESKMYDRNCFITVTFDREHLPEDVSLSVRTWQLFMKRLRKYAKEEKIRFFACGEYGEVGNRPHYHACLFNYDFADKKLWFEKNGYRVYTSEILRSVWGNGNVAIGDMTSESACYVARYVMKKVTGPAVHELDPLTDLAPYERFNSRTGEIVDVQPEFVVMSRGGRGSDGENWGGIGKKFFEKFKLDMYPHDYVIMRGIKVRPPKFYDGLYEKENPDDFKRLKASRRSRVTMIKVWNDLLQKYQMIDDNGDDRLSVKEKITESRIKTLVRSLEV